MAQSTVNNPIFARIFGLAGVLLARGELELRRRLLAGLAGTVLEVGCGSGVNFPLYPPEVTRVLAVEPESYLRRLAVRAARKAPVPVTVFDAMAEALPQADASCDAAVAALVLCTVRDPGLALSELHRVLRPGAELRFYEHVAARGRVGLRLQRACDASFWPLIAGGCHCSRDTGTAIERAGFRISRLEHLEHRVLGVPLPPTPVIFGVATRH
ncbi:MAG: class I SAM-dependent methyltransferase [Candidatus Dormibacteria bacterium]